VAIWLPDVVFGLAGLILIARMERPGDRDPLAAIGSWFGARFAALKEWMGAKPASRRIAGWRLPLLPQLIDTYILSQFLFYMALMLTSFVTLTLIWNFFELTGDMVRNKIPLSTMFTYLFFLTPALIYETLPVSVLVAVLVTFGVLSRQNEITAFKASGVSLRRLAAPILIGCTLFSAGLFAFDFYYVPGANRRQDALRDQIKGRATQTYMAADRKWIMGHGSRIYYYRYFDPSAEMLDVNVFELDSKTFGMRRQVQAERARWSRTLKKWVFENGWVSDFGPQKRSFERFQVTTFPEINETPDYFLKEQVQDKQMNFLELDGYIKDLQQSGFDTVKLQVQFYRKFSVPLFALIMAMIAVPFAFMMGGRGAMTGVGASIGIAISYWGVSTLFEAIGNVGQLPPEMAAWSPDVVFALAGLYMALRMRS
jgi:LPS export ABC transporter permease LptG